MSDKEAPQPAKRVVRSVLNTSTMQMPIPVIIAPTRPGEKPTKDFIHVAAKRRLDLPDNMQVDPNFLALNKKTIQILTKEV